MMLRAACSPLRFCPDVVGGSRSRNAFKKEEALAGADQVPDKAWYDTHPLLVC